MLMTTSAGQSQTSTVMMTQDTSSNWKIDDFTSLPAKTLNTFCTALQQKDYQTAYNQLSSTRQNSYSESQFADTYKVVTSCNGGSITLANSHVTAITTIGVSSGQTAPFTTYLITDNTGTWKIDAFFNPPYVPVLNFCNALNHGDYQTAYDQFSSGWQSSHKPESDFANAFSTVTNCSNTFPTQNGTSATSQITLTLSNGQTQVGTANLIELGDGTWKIDSLIRTA
jgi:limonene-1,2-epoxide hydrolase